MKKDIFISYSPNDQELANQVIETLAQSNSSAIFDPHDGSIGSNYADYRDIIPEMIRGTQFFIPLITENSLSSVYCNAELRYAMTFAENRAKEVLPIVEAKSLDEIPASYEFIKKFRCFLIATDEENTDSSIQELAEHIRRLKYLNLCYERLAAYKKAGVQDKMAEMLWIISDELCHAYTRETNCENKLDISIKIIQCLQNIDNLYWPAVSSFTTGRDIHESLETIWTLFIQDLKPREEDIIYQALCIKIIYYTWMIRKWLGCSKTDQEYIDYQQVFLRMFMNNLQSLDSNYDIYASEEKFASTSKEIIFWAETPKYLIIHDRAANTRYQSLSDYVIANKIVDDTFLQTVPSSCLKLVDYFTFSVVDATNKVNTIRDEDTEEKPESEESELLKQIADYINEGNRLFESIGTRENAEELIRCLLIGYQRLQQFCEIVDDQNTCGQCIDQIFSIQDRIEALPEGSRTQSGLAEDGLRALLGFQKQNTDSFDVFISHKTEDFDIAKDVYHFCHQNMLNPFLDKITLPELAESEYEKAIFMALDHSTHFIVVLSDLEYMNSRWVGVEMDTYYHERLEGRKPNGNYIMIVTDDVYQAIMDSNKQVLPIQFRKCEIMRVNEYKKAILTYLTKHINH